ncbi:hypothetical protein EYF80_064247 [Liparis tanakae]|uniref:Uncharacterized protein n=1 Tax=Liparis tanakae TaxID=230148 RepID=A0A4Z2EA82_9TELE|nr:hypothetical protein EYF80_064247 [Liparis tanakae]
MFLVAPGTPAPAALLHCASRIASFQSVFVSVSLALLGSIPMACRSFECSSRWAQAQAPDVTQLTGRRRLTRQSPPTGQSPEAPASAVHGALSRTPREEDRRRESHAALFIAF